MATRRAKYTIANTAKAKAAPRDRKPEPIDTAESDPTLLQEATRLLLSIPEVVRSAKKAMAVAVSYRLSRRSTWLDKVIDYTLHPTLGPEIGALAYGRRYWYIDGLDRVMCAVWNGTIDDHARLRVFNVFLAEKLARAAAEMQCHVRRSIVHVVLGPTVELPDGCSLRPEPQPVR